MAALSRRNSVGPEIALYLIGVSVSCLGYRVHSLLVFYSPAFPERIDSVLQGLAPGQRQHRVHACGSERVRGRGDVAVAAINGGICSEPLHQRDLVLARDAGEHARAAPLGELDRERADAAGGTVDEQRAAGLQVQRIVHAGWR
jgi:hypothetical protein